MVIETPGGGGYGKADEQNTMQVDISKDGPLFVPLASGSVGESRVLAEQV
jgi:5-oxoprolinase (ATP-hydrolysing)